MKNFEIGKGLSLPAEAVTQTFGILGKRGSGKTNTSVVLTEEMLAGGHQVVVADPLDVWYGLRSASGGTSPGYPITVLGGNHGDLPLESTAGTVIADFVVDRRVSVILSLRHFSNNDQRRFVTDFCERLFHRKGEPGKQQPLHLVLDEADEFVPQRIMAGQERMFGSIDRIVRRGRASGLGVTLISQRAAVVNKDVLTQIEALVCHRTVSPQDRKALEAWIEAHDAHDQRKAFLESLATLAVGEAWFWCPGWLDIFRRVRIRARQTFDSSSTPKPGAQALEPTALAKVDLEDLRRQMSDTIERAKADDPKELRARIRELEADLRKASALTIDPEAIKAAELRGYKRGMENFPTSLRNMAAMLRLEAPKIQAVFETAIRQLESEREGMERFIGEPPTGLVSGSKPNSRPEVVQPTATKAETAGLISRPNRPTSPPQTGLTGPEQRIVNAIAWMESIGVRNPEQSAVAFLAGYTIGGGAFNNPRGSLRTKGLIEYIAGDRISLTDDGRQVAELPELTLTADALQRRVLERLPGPERRILEALIAAYPKPLSNEQCARQAGYEPGGGAYNNPRGRLRSLGLIEYPQSGFVRARGLLFLEGR